jgi:hypothetical protein
MQPLADPRETQLLGRPFKARKNQGMTDNTNSDEVLEAADVVVVLGREAKLEPREGKRIEVWETDEPSTSVIEGK